MKIGSKISNHFLRTILESHSICRDREDLVEDSKWDRGKEVEWAWVHKVAKWARWARWARWAKWAKWATKEVRWAKWAKEAKA